MKQIITLLLLCISTTLYAEELFTLQATKVYEPYFDEDSDHTSAVIRGGLLSEKGLDQYAQQYHVGSDSAFVYNFSSDVQDVGMLAMTEIRFNIQPAMEDIGKVADVVITATFIDLPSAIKNTINAYKNGATEDTLKDSLLSTHTTSIPGLMGYVITPTEIIPTGDQVDESLYPAKFLPFSTITLQENQDITVFKGNLNHIAGAMTFMCYYKIQGEEALTYTRSPIALFIADQEMIAEIVQQELAKMDALEALSVLVNMMGQEDALNMIGMGSLGSDLGGLDNLLGGMSGGSLFNTNALDF